MISLLAAERATGAWNWLRDEGLLIVALTSGAFFFTRAIGLVSNYQAERLKRQRAAANPLDHNAAGAYQGALLGAARWGINFSIATVAIVWTLLLLNWPAAAVAALYLADPNQPVKNYLVAGLAAVAGPVLKALDSKSTDFGRGSK
jgi:hypothetical protein